MEEEVVKCPNCRKRIFDLEWNDKTVVKIKCHICKKVVTIEREKQFQEKPKAVYSIPSNGAECELPNSQMIYETQVRIHPVICVS